MAINHMWSQAIRRRMPEFEDRIGRRVSMSLLTADQLTSSYNVKLNASGADVDVDVDVDVMMVRALQDQMLVARNRWLTDLTGRVRGDRTFCAPWTPSRPSTSSTPPRAPAAAPTSRIGAPSWFPCNDHPADKASYRIEVTAPSAYTVVAAGTLDSRTVSASTTTWVYEHPAPVSTCLATVQIGLYDLAELTGAAVSPVPQRAASPPPSSRPAPGPSWRISRRTCWSRTRACRGCSTTG